MEIKLSMATWVIIALLTLVIIVIQHLLNWWYRHEIKYGAFYNDAWLSIAVGISVFILYCILLCCIL